MDVEAEPTDFRAKKWFCTVNNPTIGGEAFKEALRALGATKACISLEKAPTTGTLHLQGAFEFPGVKRRSQLLAIHAGSYDSQKTKYAYRYCAKPETHVDGPWIIGVPLPRPLLTGLEDRTLAPWQEELFAMVAVPCKEMRDVHWYWSEASKTGKSSTARYLVDKFGAAFADMTNSNESAKNIKASLAIFLDPAATGIKVGEAKDAQIMVIDIPRTALIDYSVLETIKNCLFFNTKYVPRQVRYSPIHLIVFANWAPTEKDVAEAGSARIITHEV